MEQNFDQPKPPLSDGKGLGIAALVIGVLALMFSFIPCLGMWALLPAIVGIILSAISMAQSSKAGVSKSNAIAGLICSAIALLLAAYWIYITVTMVSSSSEMYMEMQQSGTLDSLTNAMQQEIDIIDTANTK